MDCETTQPSGEGAGDMAMDVDLGLNVSVSEVSKGGLKYEVILGESKIVTPPRVASPAVANAKPVLSAELIQLKIDAAAERRLSMESERLAALALKLRKVEETVQKKEVGLEEFKNNTKENLERNMKIHIENRESIISDLKTKMSTYTVTRLQEVKQNLETSMTEQEEKIKQKLEAAEKNRELKLQEKIENLKKHDEKVEQIRTKFGKRNSVGVEAKTDEAVTADGEAKQEN